MHRTFVSQAIVLLRPLLRCSCLGDDLMFISVFIRICLYGQNKSGLWLLLFFCSFLLSLSLCSVLGSDGNKSPVMNEHMGQQVKSKQQWSDPFIWSKVDCQIYNIIIIIQCTFKTTKYFQDHTQWSVTWMTYSIPKYAAEQLQWQWHKWLCKLHEYILSCPSV